MEYFIMRQDPRVYNAAEPTGADISGLRHMTREEINAVSMPINLYIKNTKAAEFPDYIEKPLMLVSEKLKKIMSKYQKDVIFKTVILIEKGTNRQEIYYLISAPQIDCASGETTYDKRGNINDLVIDEKKIGGARIFFTGKNEKLILVRLDAAESILRRDSNGVLFEKCKAVNAEGVMFRGHTRE